MSSYFKNSFSKYGTPVKRVLNNSKSYEKINYKENNSFKQKKDKNKKKENYYNFDELNQIDKVEMEQQNSIFHSPNASKF